MKRIILSIFLLSLTASCSSPNTHGKFISAEKDVWINGYDEQGEGAGKGLLFCQANTQDDSRAKPVCYPAKFKD